MGLHPKPIHICRICGDPTPHIHPGDDPTGEAVPIAIQDARTTPAPSVPLSEQETKRFVVVKFDPDEEEEEDDDFDPEFVGF